jgi:excisionase family DNA binding protein
MASNSEAAEPQTLTTAEAAKRLGISMFLAKKLIRTGELPSFKLGNKRLIPKYVVDEILDGPRRARGGDGCAGEAGRWAAE